MSKAGAKIIKSMEQAVVIAPYVARIADLEAALAAEKLCHQVACEGRKRDARQWEDAIEAEAEARREAEGEVERLRSESTRLRIAFHDAIRRPLGVTPDSGTEFYDHRMADEAEVRRPRSPR